VYPNGHLLGCTGGKNYFRMSSFPEINSENYKLEFG
jgi:hypothetical protein